MSAPLVFSLAEIEGRHLARIVDDFIELVGTKDAADHAIARLTPDAYPEDAAASAEFGIATRDDLLDRRLLDARTMRSALTAFDGAAELTVAEAQAMRQVAVRRADIDAWLRTLTAIRLVLAERLGITTEDVGGGRTDGTDLYDWLGYRLELLIEAADELLTDSGS